MVFLKKLLKERSKSSSIELSRYVVVGGLSFVTHFIILIILTEIFSVHYLLSAGIAFTTALVLSYILSIRWVFSRRTITNKNIEFGVFALIGIVGLFLNEFFLWFFTEKIFFHYLLSQVVAAILVLGWNFTARKLALFR